MGEPKAFASLSSGLLARKGQAKPAMRPQGFGGFGMSPAALEDLGWNDMGTGPAAMPATADIVPFAPIVHDAEPAVTPTPTFAPEALPSVVLQQQEELAREFAAAVPPSPRAASGSKGRAAFTLRLDPERHLKLRLAAAVSHRSAQAIVVAALDAFLDKHAPPAPESIQ